MCYLRIDGDQHACRVVVRPKKKHFHFIENKTGLSNEVKGQSIVVWVQNNGSGLKAYFKANEASHPKTLLCSLQRKSFHPH